MLRKKPWNRINLPVYSVSSFDGITHNMNICTYVSAVSMTPKRFMVAVYYHTKTIENVRQQKKFALQLLADTQYNMVNLLGKQSGNKINKFSRLQKRNAITPWKEYFVLNDCLAVMELKVIKTIDAGDHLLCLCDMLQYENLNAGDALTLDRLREKKLVRI